MTDERGYWEELERPGPDFVTVAGVDLRRGSRVRLAPKGSRDIFDLALAGQTAVIEKVETDMEGELHLVVLIDDDPGRDMGQERRPGHRFFFSAEEVEPLPGESPAPGGPRVLVAGLGNVFLGDDGWGVAVADRLARSELPAGVHVADFGIRGMDLAYALADYDAVILVDAVPRGEAPGTLYLIEPEELGDLSVAPEVHGMDPVKVLAMARELGELPERILVVGCEPSQVMTGEEEDVVVELSEPVRAAIGEGVRMVESLLVEITTSDQEERKAKAQ